MEELSHTLHTEQYAYQRHKWVHTLAKQPFKYPYQCQIQVEKQALDLPMTSPPLS